MYRNKFYKAIKDNIDQRHLFVKTYVYISDVKCVCKVCGRSWDSRRDSSEYIGAIIMNTRYIV